MANGLTMDDVRRMQELEAELMRLRAIQNPVYFDGVVSVPRMVGS